MDKGQDKYGLQPATEQNSVSLLVLPKGTRAAVSLPQDFMEASHLFTAGFQDSSLKSHDSFPSNEKERQYGRDRKVVAQFPVIEMCEQMQNLENR